MADIEKLFNQVKVSPECRDFLRLFSFESNRFDGKPCEFRLTVHLLGATSSPPVANFALQRTVVDNPECSDICKSTVMRNFYVDDLLCSTNSNKTALSVATEVKEVLSKGGFNIAEFFSNSQQLVKGFSDCGYSESVKDKTFSLIGYDRALGMQWNTAEDSLKFKVNEPSQPVTRRGILS